jgi:hypothetical protein
VSSINPRILGQSMPAANTRDDLVDVQPNTWLTPSVLMACNQSSEPTTIQVSVAAQGVAHLARQFIYYNVPISGNDTFYAEFAINLAQRDVMRVLSANGLVSFHLFGDMIRSPRP